VLFAARLIDVELARAAVAVKLGVLVLELKGRTYWYRDKPFGPPQMVDKLPAQVIEQRPSVAITEPEASVLPQ
jgi:hypothetical protein